MFYKKTKLLKIRELQLNEQEAKLTNCNSENLKLNLEIQELKKKYSKFIEHDSLFINEKKAFDNLIQDMQVLNEKYKDGLDIHNSLEREIRLFKDTIEIGSYGLYEPRFNFDFSDSFKKALQYNFEAQKRMISLDSAIICHTSWTVNNSIVEGRKMTNKHKKLWMLAFNGECDSIMSTVKWNNVVKSKERIIYIFDKLNKLGEIDSLEIQRSYLDLKIEELELKYEYELKKYEEKEEQKRIREQIREEEKALRDYEKAKKEAEDDEKYLQNTLEKIKQRFGIVTQDELIKLNEKVRELESQILDAQNRKERAIALAQTTKVGYIYVISNIGSLGEDVYKIGMTRRLDPQDRIDELSNASVPFRFDVHASIFSENAPQLEYELHKKFSANRINRVNRRKEFFNVKLEEIEKYVSEFSNANIEFLKNAEAREYRESLVYSEPINVDSLSSEFENQFPDSLFD